MATKFVARELEPGRWALDFVTSAGTTSGHTTFPTSEAAIAAAKDRDPTVEVEVQTLSD